MIKNIVFDIGDVLVGYNPEKYVKQLKMNINKVNTANDILTKSNEWREYLNGNIELKEVLKVLHIKYPNLKKEFNVLLEKENVKNILYEISENINLLKDLSVQYDIYLLSNITKETFESVKEKFDFVKYVKGGVYSYKEHISKPEKEIFQRLMQRYNLKAEETIFIDDKLKNINVAKKMGMIGIQYRTNKPLREELGGAVN